MKNLLECEMICQKGISSPGIGRNKRDLHSVLWQKDRVLYEHRFWFDGDCGKERSRKWKKMKAMA